MVAPLNDLMPRLKACAEIGVGGRDPSLACAEAYDWIDRLVDALEPFRKVAEEHDVWGDDRDSSPMLIEHCEGGQDYDITLGDLRRVREILAQFVKSP